ncbi:hypothetical protein SB659_18285 [Arthrobacter sp. SIMBA_036]
MFSKKGGLNRRPWPPVHDDLVERDFTAAAPNELWPTDITEHPTAEGKYNGRGQAMDEATAIKPNLDYPTGPTYHLMGFDTPTFAPIFVASRFQLADPPPPLRLHRH